MFSVSHKDFTLLLNIIDAIEKIKSYSSEYLNADELYANTKSFDAVLMNFIVIGEMGSKLSDSFRTKTSDNIDWYKTVGFRNIIAHNYFGVDAEEVWQIIRDTLLKLENNLKQIVE